MTEKVNVVDCYMYVICRIVDHRIFISKNLFPISSFIYLMMKIKLNMRMLLAMVLGIQRDQVIAATLWPVVTEPCLLIGRCVITKNEP